MKAQRVQETGICMKERRKMNFKVGMVIALVAFVGSLASTVQANSDQSKVDVWQAFLKPKYFEKIWQYNRTTL